MCRSSALGTSSLLAYLRSSTYGRRSSGGDGGARRQLSPGAARRGAGGRRANSRRERREEHWRGRARSHLLDSWLWRSLRGGVRRDGPLGEAYERRQLHGRVGVLEQVDEAHRRFGADIHPCHRHPWYSPSSSSSSSSFDRGAERPPLKGRERKRWKEGRAGRRSSTSRTTRGPRGRRGGRCGIHLGERGRLRERAARRPSTSPSTSTTTSSSALCQINQWRASQE